MRMLKNLRPGITEYEVGMASRVGFAPACMFSLTNFGAEHVAIGLRSPDDVTTLKLGEVCGITFFTLPPGGFLVLGILLAVFGIISNKGGKDK